MKKKPAKAWRWRKTGRDCARRSTRVEGEVLGVLWLLKDGKLTTQKHQVLWLNNSVIALFLGGHILHFKS